MIPMKLRHGNDRLIRVHVANSIMGSFKHSVVHSVAPISLYETSLGLYTSWVSPTACSQRLGFTTYEPWSKCGHFSHEFGDGPLPFSNGFNAHSMMMMTTVASMMILMIIMMMILMIIIIIIIIIYIYIYISSSICLHVYKCLYI